MSDYFRMAKVATKYLGPPLFAAIFALVLRRGPPQIDELSLAERGEMVRLVDLLIPAASAAPAGRATGVGAQGLAQAGGPGTNQEPDKEADHDDDDDDDDDDDVDAQHANAEVQSHASTAAASHVAVAGDEDLGDEGAANAAGANERFPDAERLWTIDNMVYECGAFFNDIVFHASPAELDYDQVMDDLLVLERADNTQDVIQTGRQLEQVTTESGALCRVPALLLTSVDDKGGETA